MQYFSEGDINGYFPVFKVNGQDSCGQVHWQAAKTKAKSLQKLDETGVMVAGCRHALMQKAVNMWTGEMYGYGFYLQVRVVVQRYKLLLTIVKVYTRGVLPHAIIILFMIVLYVSVLDSLIPVTQCSGNILFFFLSVFACQA